MKTGIIIHPRAFTIIIIFFLVGCFASVRSQGGRVGIHTSMPITGFHVKDSSVLFTGKYPLPIPPSGIPTSGPGTRLMWYPDKAAFRVGQVTAGEWDTIGIASFAAGYNTRASHQYSTALGAIASAKGINAVAIGRDVKAHATSTLAIGVESNALGISSAAIGSMNNSLGPASLTIGTSNTANGEGAISIGSGNTVNGSSALALGTLNTANGFYSSALGVNSIASGDFSNTFGFSIKSNAFLQTTFGQYNDTTFTVDPSGWIPTDPLFVIGNGDEVTLRNAVTVLKNGNTGIGIRNPTALLQVNGTSTFGANGSVINEIIKASVTKDVNNIPAQSTMLETFSVPNSQTGSTVHISPDNALPGGIMIGYARVSVNGTVEVSFANITGGALNPANTTYHITVIR